MKRILRWLLTVLMVVAGANHFRIPDVYVAMMPAAVPWPLELVYLSGLCEILGGLGLVLPRPRRLAAWGLVALLLAVFPANLNMAVNQLPLGDVLIPTWVLWARLPVQVLLIVWALWYTRPEPTGPGVGHSLV